MSSALLLLLLVGAVLAQTNSNDTDVSTLDTCILNADGSFSGPGTCSGPIERSLVRASNLSITNGGCPIDQVLFYVDGDPAQPKCGECKPGASGLEDPQLSCRVNDFCDDGGRCRSAKSSPLYDQPCPWEQGGLTRYGWCGPGLRCINHKCVICIEGVLDPSDGKRCVHGEWTYSVWVALVYNPNAIFQLCTLLLLALYLLFLIIKHTPAWKITKRWGKKVYHHISKLPKKIPSIPIPPFRKNKNPTATTTPANTSTDALGPDNQPSPANQSIEMEEIDNYLQANADLRDA